MSSAINVLSTGLITACKMRSLEPEINETGLSRKLEQSTILVLLDDADAAPTVVMERSTTDDSTSRRGRNEKRQGDNMMRILVLVKLIRSSGP